MYKAVTVKAKYDTDFKPTTVTGWFIETDGRAAIVQPDGQMFYVDAETLEVAK